MLVSEWLGNYDREKFVDPAHRREKIIDLAVLAGSLVKQHDKSASLVLPPELGRINPEDIGLSVSIVHRLRFKGRKSPQACGAVLNYYPYHFLNETGSTEVHLFFSKSARDEYLQEFGERILRGVLMAEIKFAKN